MADETWVIVPIANALFSLDTLVEAGALMKSAPERLTETHVSHLAHYCSERELAIVIQKRDAAIARRADEEALAAAHARATVGAQAAPPFDIAALEGIATIDELCTRFPDAPVTLGLIGPLHAFVMEINERNKERNTKIAALEARVLELEASAAAVRS